MNWLEKIYWNEGKTKAKYEKDQEKVLGDIKYYKIMYEQHGEELEEIFYKKLSKCKTKEKKINLYKSYIKWLQNQQVWDTDKIMFDIETEFKINKLEIRGL